MAVSGGATTAYRVRLENGAMVTVATTALRSRCASVTDAVRLLGEGKSALVAGSDVQAVRLSLLRVEDDGPASLNEVVNEHWPEGWE